MNSIKTVRTKYAFLASLGQTALALVVLSLFLFLPETAFADIENLYAEGYSSSVTITNPINAHGELDGNTAYGSYADANVRNLGGFRDQYLLSDMEGSLLVDFYYQYSPLLASAIQGNRHLRSITRMGLLPLAGVRAIFTRINLAERWPLLITIAVIISVLLYMELLIRTHRGLATKSRSPEKDTSLLENIAPREIGAIDKH
jgi:hypothetical protein